MGIKSLLKFICTNQPGQDDFSNKLSKLVELLKDNEKFRSDYTAMNLHDRDITRAAKKEGIAEGEQRKAIEAASEFLKENISPEIIARCVKLPLEQIKQLQMQLNG